MIPTPKPNLSSETPDNPAVSSVSTPKVLMPESEVQSRVTALADLLALYLKPDCVVVCLLTGGLWFAADLSRALSRLGHHPSFDALWLSSYGDAHESGEMIIRAPLQRSVEGRQVLIVDDVLETGASLRAAVRIAEQAGATEVLTCVFARKTDPVYKGHARDIEADFSAWEAPSLYLVGYGMDSGGLYRGLPYIGALD